MSALLAGVARVTITPPVGMYLPGMERTENSHGLRDDLYATALAVSDGTTEAIIVSCDLLMLHPSLVRRVREEAAAQTGVPGANMMFCATHCHSGAVSYAWPSSRPMFRAYVENLGFLLVGVVRLAHDRMVPARLGYGRGEAHIGMNRRLTRPDGVTVIGPNPEGPVDPELGLLRIDTAAGRPLAVLVNYACHPVVLGNGSNVISADWPGAMRRTLELATGATCLFVQGAGADINPLPGVPSDDEAVLERLGTEIGGIALATWAAVAPEPAGQVAVSGRRVLLPLLLPWALEGRLPQFVELGGAVEGLSWAEMQAMLDETMPWTQDIVGEGDGRRVLMELQAIRIGAGAVVSAAGEVFCRTGMEVKRRSPLAHTMFAGYTNGGVCYVPRPEDYPRGGYEVNEAYIGYRLPAPLAPEAAGIVEGTALDLLQQLI